jgi:ribonucleoside-diphosphate reductase alpha chain
LSVFKTTFAENIFNAKYSNGMTWRENTERLVEEVCSGLLPMNEYLELVEIIYEMKFIPAGRYLYYAGQEANFYNNCFCLGAQEDTREEWCRITHNAMSCLMSGGGIGVDYSKFRPAGAPLGRTGGVASGPIPLMKVMNEVGRNVMQGGSRRSAMYASLHWLHSDCLDFIHAKDWSEEVKALKAADFNFPADLDMTNISVNYDDLFFEAIHDKKHKYHYRAKEIWMHNITQALKTAEPGWSINLGENSKDTLRNACTEFTSEDDSDVCNLGSVNFGNIESRVELARVTYLASKFLVCGGYRADLPYEGVVKTREKNRKIGLGLMGLHEWLLKKGYSYEMNDELHEWLYTWKAANEAGANAISDKIDINRPKKYRAIAPTGTIGILASTTTGIEPLFAVAYKRRYLTNGTKWNYEYVIDATAQRLIDEYDLDPDSIETSSSLSDDPERRIKFQADVQDYVDMAISSTLNLPAYEDQTFTANQFSEIVLKYAPRLRGLTCYPDGSRGGQPLTAVPYYEAKNRTGTVFDETEEKCSGGVCGL